MSTPIPPPSPARETEQVAALADWCDCTACLRTREADRALLPRPSRVLHSSADEVGLGEGDMARWLAAKQRQSPVRDPATVIDLSTARQRAMPRETREHVADMLLEGSALNLPELPAAIEPAVHLGTFRGQVPQLSRRRFWQLQLAGWLLLALVAWWAVH